MWDLAFKAALKRLHEQRARFIFIGQISTPRCCTLGDWKISAAADLTCL